MSDYATCEALRVALREADVDGDGALSLDEFRAAMDRDGTLRCAAEEARMSRRGKEFAFLDAETLFCRFNADNSNSISAEELRQFFMETDNCACD